jgi:hypothetical protein
MAQNKIYEGKLFHGIATNLQPASKNNHYPLTHLTNANKGKLIIIIIIIIILEYFAQGTYFA